MRTEMTEKARREIEADFDNTREAWTLLDLIDSEFHSDPMSTQCFDERIVERVRKCIARRKEFVKNSPFGGA